MPLFSKTKSPKEVVLSIRDLLLQLKQLTTVGSERDRNRVLAELTRHIWALKELLSSSATGVHRSAGDDAHHSSNGSDAASDSVMVEVLAELQVENTLFHLLDAVERMEWEASKATVEIFSLLMHWQVANSRPMVSYLQKNPRCLLLLIHGYGRSEKAVQYGSLLRQVTRHEPLTMSLLYSPDFYVLFNYVQNSGFEVSTDVFLSLRDLLTRHKQIVAKFLEANYDKFFVNYQSLLQADNYVLKRQALKLLSELLLERANFAVMMKYIGNPDHLKLIMNLLKAKEKQIEFEAFHCFKVFVANPNKSRAVHSILWLNRDKLVEYLTTFLPDRNDDASFVSEKSYLLRTIREMKSPNDNPPPGSASSSTSSSATPTNSANPNIRYQQSHNLRPLQPQPQSAGFQRFPVNSGPAPVAKVAGVTIIRANATPPVATNTPPSAGFLRKL